MNQSCTNQSKSNALKSGSFFHKSGLSVVLWSFAWTSTMVLADKAELYGWYSAPWMAISGIVVNTVIGIGMIFNFIGYLNSIDELQRKIQLEALAISMGVTLVGSFTYSLLVTSKFVMDVEVSDIILLTVASYIAAVIYGQVKYR